jgi:heme-degrading monooxygenase HmoA
MFVLNIELSVRSGSEQLLSQTFKTAFMPAISKQEGFTSAALWRPEIANAEYRLVIEFENQALQQKWVAAQLHQEVWPQIEGHCVNYVVHTYTSI